MVREIDIRIRRDAEEPRSLWTYEGFLYTKVRDLSDGMTLKCKTCDTQLRVVGRHHALDQVHTHGADPDLVVATEVEHEIKRRGLGRSAEDIERIYNDVLRERK